MRKRVVLLTVLLAGVAPVWLRADGGADTCTDGGNGGRGIGQ